MSDTEKPEGPAIKVVDRRWWTQPGADAVRAETPTLKPTYVEALEQQLAEKDAQLQSTIARYRDAASEFDESRARLRKEIAREVERGRRTMLVELLEVIDNLDRALDAARDAANADVLRQGVELVRDQFLGKLEGFGVRRLEVVGQPFDPTHHEAVTTVPVTAADQDHHVVGLIKHGYVIGDEVLRPALVAVGRFTTGSETTTGNQTTAEPSDT